MKPLRLVILACLFICGSSVEASQPNIVFVFVDDLGWGDLGLFYQNQSQHNQTHRTPNLDRLGSGGLQMRSHYCPAPVCAPSRASLLTGVHQGNAAVRDNQFDKELEDNATLGSVLQAAGYRTCMIGKYGLQGGEKEKGQTGTPDDWPAYPTKRGFDEFFGYVSHYAGHLHYPNDPWKLANEGHRSLPNVWASDESGDHEISEQLNKCYTTDVFTARAKHFLKNHVAKRSDQPFFLMLNYDTPHAALQVPTGTYPAGGGTKAGLQWTGGNDLSKIAQPAINTATGQVDSFLHPDYAGKDWKDVDKRFATMVRRIDSAVGDLNKTLDELGLAENTLVIFTSDNGPHHEAYLDGGKWGDGTYTPQAFQSYGPYDGVKRDCWEGGIRMPTLAWWKGRIEGERIDSTPSQFHDWMATFCDLAQAPTPARCDGVSLVPTLIGEGEQIDSTVYIEYENRGSTPKYNDFERSRRGQPRKQMQVIRMRATDGVLYKGVRYDINSASDDFQIFDVESDPSEQKNLAGTSPAMEALQTRMQARVLQLRSKNESALRPYDNALIPEDANSKNAFQVLRADRIDGVDYVPAVPGSAKAALSTVSSSNGQYTFVATKPGLYQISGCITVTEAGPHTLTVTSDAPCFVRLHQGHAVDVPSLLSRRTVKASRQLAAGNHPITLTVHAQSAGDTIQWSCGN
ncbi:MAG: arylsulfatase [Aureliella sp.]